jgi:cysteinyl-tRNA synthetase
LWGYDLPNESKPALRLYNTLIKAKEELVPLDPANVRMYVCGPTVYDFAHIGNARPVIVFDVLFRLLRHVYGPDHVTYARNLTDVDDKISARARRDFPGEPLNEAINKVTSATTAQFHADVAALGCLAPTAEPRATDHIGEMRAIIERLVARGVAYVAEEHVLFNVPAAKTVAGTPAYGSLARRSLDEMIAGARVDVAPYKRDATDFVLWKPSTEGQEPGWPSPCGITTPGRPGWHIECSAMSMAKLLEPFGGGLSCDDPAKNTFDIHGGGIDLVFPHHENEIAQSCCAFSTERMASIWMHNGFLQVEGKKMSKSEGNFVTIHQLLHTTDFGGRTWPGEVLRLAMLKTHYRQPIDWTVRALEEAEATLERWYNHLRGRNIQATVPDAEIVNALIDDLNTVAAVSQLHYTFASGALGEEGAEAGYLMAGGGIEDDDWAAVAKASLIMLGIDSSDGTYKLRKLNLTADQLEEISSLITARNAARAAKNWPESDRIRAELDAMGIALKDGKDEAGNPVSTWEVKR